MPITLTTESVPASTHKRGYDDVSMSAGQHLKVETTPDGEELLDAVVPAGKAWNVIVNVFITESNA